MAIKGASETISYSLDLTELSDEDIAAIPNAKLRDLLRKLRATADENATAKPHSKAHITGGWERSALA